MTASRTGTEELAAPSPRSPYFFEVEAHITLALGIAAPLRSECPMNQLDGGSSSLCLLPGMDREQACVLMVRGKQKRWREHCIICGTCEANSLIPSLILDPRPHFFTPISGLTFYNTVGLQRWVLLETLRKGSIIIRWPSRLVCCSRAIGGRCLHLLCCLLLLDVKKN